MCSARSSPKGLSRLCAALMPSAWARAERLLSPHAGRLDQPLPAAAPAAGAQARQPSPAAGAPSRARHSQPSPATQPGCHALARAGVSQTVRIGTHAGLRQAAPADGVSTTLSHCVPSPRRRRARLHLTFVPACRAGPAVGVAVQRPHARMLLERAAACPAGELRAHALRGDLGRGGQPAGPQYSVQQHLLLQRAGARPLVRVRVCSSTCCCSAPVRAPWLGLGYAAASAAAARRCVPQSTGHRMRGRCRPTGRCCTCQEVVRLCRRQRAGDGRPTARLAAASVPGLVCKQARLSLDGQRQGSLHVKNRGRDVQGLHASVHQQEGQ
jgi:hypothetical protein